jgi:hypothetical protein
MTNQARTLGELKRTSYRSQTVRSEIRANLRRKLAARQELFPGIVGYERTVIPAIANASSPGTTSFCSANAGRRSRACCASSPRSSIRRFRCSPAAR